ncbi:MAG: hypothetical protein GWN00_33435, partial [Aliifodinibius sp.]|nr:hypothetical protein [Fodinibius sp.]NIV11040.1 hypothetical protein [Fodinibius sp.]NIY29515.1 hypothetical protein [Fodinibius sp.]
LVLKEVHFRVENVEMLQAALKKYIQDEHLQTVISFMNRLFTPGELMAFFDEKAIKLNVNSEIFLGEILDHCRRISETEHGEGFWIDHWTYNLDLLENYLAVFPDKFLSLLFTGKIFSFYDNPHIVQPRSEKYVLWNGKAMQLGAVTFDEEKAKLIEERKSQTNQVRTDYGRGDIYLTTLFNKILCLIVNKLSSLDPEGVGIEMEAGKPGWYDALNGLPGLFGSSICETLEIKRHILFLLEIISEYEVIEVNKETILIFEELKEFMDKLHDLLNRGVSSFEYWDAASNAREYYREITRLGVSGKEIPVELSKIKAFFEAALGKLNSGIEKGLDKQSNTIFTYFRCDVTDYKKLEITDSRRGKKMSKYSADGLQCIRPLQFKQIPLPLFLEGPVHYLRCLPEKEKASQFAANVKKSPLYDKSLKMYKVNTSLTHEPMEIGRARVFSPGWLENESIWLHMEYKYMLELLRNGLYDDLYNDFKNIFVPFMNPSVYGRSILENSSFLVSSAHPDPSIHGNGFVARLSGATAEFIHILVLMVLGPRPFSLDNEGELQLHFRPSLPAWIFTQKAGEIRVYQENNCKKLELPARSFSFMFLGQILITYHNEGLKDTYGDNGAKPVEYRIYKADGNIQSFRTGNLSGTIVNEIRERKVNRIEIELR